MSYRLNFYGFSIARMRSLCGSGDSALLTRIQEQAADRHPHLPGDTRDQVAAILERAVMQGVPFRDVNQETWAHSLAASELVQHGQDLMMTDASHYPMSALTEELWPRWGRHADPLARAFLRGISEGIPLFGTMPSPDGPYAAISLEKLQAIHPQLESLAELIAWRVNRQRQPAAEDETAVQFSAELTAWVGTIIDAGRDLWSQPG